MERDSHSLTKVIGQKINARGVLSIQEAFGPRHTPEKISCIEFPYSPSLSKNGLWSMGRGGGHVYVREIIKKQRQQMTALIRNTIARDGMVFLEGKVWLFIHIQKSNAKADAVNFVDLICDAVKDAIDVDDRWFCIAHLDWEIVKKDPQIYIGVGQHPQTEHHRVCSYCGRILPAHMFTKHKGNRLGIGRECRECIKQKRAAKRALKAKE